MAPTGAKMGSCKRNAYVNDRLALYQDKKIIKESKARKARRARNQSARP